MLGKQKGKELATVLTICSHVLNTIKSVTLVFHNKHEAKDRDVCICKPPGKVSSAVAYSTPRPPAQVVAVSPGLRSNQE
ncbi:hypothetical protein A6R68_03915, partial [Neotoma lepida]